ncbi:MAG: hypothetical protein KGH62_02770 [Candidatus Micrarchaeota archaeon]|nr:hypothetical protein [Candidatus Micrarchaeota archaeon]
MENLALIGISCALLLNAFCAISLYLLPFLTGQSALSMLYYASIILFAFSAGFALEERSWEEMSTFSARTAGLMVLSIIGLVYFVWFFWILIHSNALSALELLAPGMIAGYLVGRRYFLGYFLWS